MGEEVNATMSTMNDGPAYELPAEPWTTEASRAEAAAARKSESERREQRLAAREAAFLAKKAPAPHGEPSV